MKAFCDGDSHIGRCGDGEIRACREVLDGRQPTGMCQRWERLIYVATDERGIVIDWCRHADADEGWLGPRFRYGEIGVWLDEPPAIGKPLPWELATGRIWRTGGTARCDGALEAFCESIAWTLIALGATAPRCPERRVYRPCGRCGHSVNEHSEGCDVEHCACALYRHEHERVESTDLSTRASCNDVCTCGGEHHDGAAYYVSARRSNGDACLLLGPYASHSFALSLVETGRRLAVEADPFNVWLAVGTLALRGDERPLGKLNDMLSAEEATSIARKALCAMGSACFTTESPANWVPASLSGWQCPACEVGKLEAVSDTGHVRCTCGGVCVDKDALRAIAEVSK